MLFTTLNEFPSIENDTKLLEMISKIPHELMLIFLRMGGEFYVCVIALSAFQPFRSVL